MKTDPVSARSSSVRRIAVTVSALSIAATAACFSIGLVVVNLRLAQYGVFSSEFAKAEYVLVGALFVFIGTAALFSVSLFFLEVKAGIESWRARRV